MARRTASRMWAGSWVRTARVLDLTLEPTR